MPTETKAAFARRHGVNRSTVNKWEAKGHLQMTADGLVDVARSEARMAKRPDTYRGGVAKGVTAPAEAAPPTAVVPAIDPNAVAIDGLGLVVREIGAFAARMAVEFGASLRVAYALDTAVCLEASAIAERFLTAQGESDFANGWSLLELQGTDVVEPDWPALAAEAGEPLDLDALGAWLDRLPHFQRQGAQP